MKPTLPSVSFRTATAVIAAALTLNIFLSSILLGQTTAGSLHGVITDTSGGVIPDVEVVVKNSDTDATRAITTNSVGLFTARELPPRTLHGPRQ